MDKQEFIRQKKKELLQQQEAKRKEIQRRRDALKSDSILQSQFFDQLISRVQHPNFLSSVVDMDLTSVFVNVLKDTQNLSKIQFEFLVPFLPLIAWQLSHVDLSWTLTQPQNNHQQLEHITTEILRYSHKIVSSVVSKDIPENYLDGINNYIIFKQINTTVSILCGYSEDFSYVEVLKLFTETENLCYPVFEVTQETTKKMEIAVEGVLHETIPTNLKGRIPDAYPQITSDSLRSMLHGAVADSDALPAKEKEEKAMSTFDKLVEKNQTIFNWELLSVGTFLQYCISILEHTDANEDKFDEVQQAQRVATTLRLVRSVLTFIGNFETIEPTCVGDVVSLLNVLVTMHEHLCAVMNLHTYCDYLCECLFSASGILKNRIGNQVVYVNMEAYIAARLFGSLFSSEHDLNYIVKCVEDKKEVPLPCLFSTALAFMFSRDIFSRLQSKKQTVVDPNNYKNFAKGNLQLEVYTHKIDVFAVNTFDFLTELILSPNGVFLNTLFSLLLTAFVGIGYEEAMEKMRIHKFETDVEEKTYNSSTVDFEMTRIVPLFLAVYIFVDSPCKALNLYVKNYFKREHIQALWTIIIAQSPHVSLNGDGNEPFGPLVSDAESITNLRVLLKQIVNNRKITDTNITYLLEKRRDEYTLVVPVELAVFTARLWIHRIGYYQTIQGKDDPLAINEWEKFLSALQNLISTKDEWKGEECVGYETVCLMLFIFHNLSRDSRILYMRKLFKIILNAPVKINTKGVVGLTRALLILDYMLRYHNDFSVDLLNELKNALLSRSFEEHGSMTKDTCIIPAFIEKLNYKDALFSVAMETKNKVPPMNGYIRFYGFTKYTTYENYLTDLRLGMHYPLGSVVMLTETADYNKVYDRLLGLLRDCSVQQPTDKSLETITFILGEYFFNSLWMILCLLPPPQAFIEQFKDRKLFKTLPVGNLILHYVNWMTNLCYLTNKQKSKFYKEVDISNIKLKDHVENLIDILKRIRSEKEKVGGRTDAIIETIVHFLTCASLNGKYLDTYRHELILRKANNTEALAREKLTQTEEDKKKFETAAKNLQTSAKKEEKAEKEKAKQDLKNVLKEEKTIKKEGILHGIKGLKSLIKKDAKVTANGDASAESLENKVLASDARRKRKVLKKREEWAEPVNSPDKLYESISDVVFKHLEEFYDMCGGLLEDYVKAVKTNQLGGVIDLDRGMIIDRFRKKEVDWKRDGIIAVLCEGVQKESLKKYIEGMVLTTETVNFVVDRWGSKLYLWSDEFYHPLQHILDSVVSCPIRPTNHAYFATVSSTQKIVKSVVSLSTLISIQSNAKHTFESNKLMNNLLQIIPDIGFGYTKVRAVELATKIGGDKKAELLIAQSKISRCDEYLRFVLNQKTVSVGTVDCVLDCLSVMKNAIAEVKKQSKKVDYYLQKTPQFSQGDLKLYLLVGGKLRDMTVLRRIEEYLQLAMSGDDSMKRIFSKVLKEWKNPEFGEWCMEKIIGTEKDNVFIESGEKEEKELFDFLESVVGSDVDVKKDVLQKLVESVPLVVENYGKYIKKYFTLIFSYIVKQKEGGILVEGITKWFKNIPIEKTKTLKECNAFSELLYMVYNMFCQIKESGRSQMENDQLPEVVPQTLLCSKNCLGEKNFAQRMYMTVNDKGEKMYICEACQKCCFNNTNENEYCGIVEKVCQCTNCRCKTVQQYDPRQKVALMKQVSEETERLYEIDFACKKSTVKLDAATSKSFENTLMKDTQLGKEIFEFFRNMSIQLTKAQMDEIEYTNPLFTNQEVQLSDFKGKFLMRELLTKEQLQMNTREEDTDDAFVNETNLFTYDNKNRMYRVVEDTGILRGTELVPTENVINSIKAHPTLDGLLLVSTKTTVALLLFNEQKSIEIVSDEEDAFIHRVEWLASKNEFVVFTHKFVRFGVYKDGEVYTEEYSIDSIIMSGTVFWYGERQYILVVSNQVGDIYIQVIDCPLTKGRFKMITKSIKLNFSKHEVITWMEYLGDIDSIALTYENECYICKFDSMTNSVTKHFVLKDFEATSWRKLNCRNSFYCVYGQSTHNLFGVSFNKDTVEKTKIMNKKLGGVAVEPRVGYLSVGIFNEGAVSISYIPEPELEDDSIKGVSGDISQLVPIETRLETDNAFNLVKNKKVFYNRLFVTNLNENFLIKAVRLHFKSDTVPISVLVGRRRVQMTTASNIITVFMTDEEVVKTDPLIELTLIDCVNAEHLPYTSKVEAFGVSKISSGYDEIRMKIGLREKDEQQPLIMPVHHICKTSLVFLLRYFELNSARQEKTFLDEVLQDMTQMVLDPTNAYIHLQITQIIKYLTSSKSELNKMMSETLIQRMQGVNSKYSYKHLSVFLLKANAIIKKYPSLFTSNDSIKGIDNLLETCLKFSEDSVESRDSFMYQATKLMLQRIKLKEVAGGLNKTFMDYVKSKKYGNIVLNALCNEMTSPLVFAKYNQVNVMLEMVPMADCNKRIVSCLISQTLLEDADTFLRVCQLIYVCFTAKHLSQVPPELIKSTAKYLVGQMNEYSKNHLVGLHAVELVKSFVRSSDTKQYQIFLETLKTLGETNFEKGVLLYPSHYIGKSIANELEAKSVEDVLHTVLTEEIKAIGEGKNEVITTQSSHSLPLYKSKEMKSVEIAVDVLQTLFYLQVHYKEKKMVLLDGAKWKGLLEEIIVLETQGVIPRGVVSKELLYELSGSSHLYHQATDKKRYEKILTLLDGSERKEMIETLTQASKVARKRPSNWQKFVSDNSTIFGGLMKWARSDVSDISVPAILLYEALMTTSVIYVPSSVPKEVTEDKEKDGETDEKETQIVNEELKTFGPTRTKFASSIIGSRGIGDLVYMTAYSKTEVVRESLMHTFKMLYKVGEQSVRKRVWAFFSNVLEKPQLAPISKEYLSVMKTLALLNEINERGITIPFVF
ncbi:hypothetical protein EIN_468310 [Entamoeba invadens IP1]|uniref:Uncharacterized protein n=1 Tax=Entamoeba invadens IP1 TaxID=370355 RepID=A0A0A1TUH2_ENTIV|nr:hypothetical protein EIN_468310 [Entamoeba invadens IP1]ELP83697.1 hypothetical protein EIN_468310 [Entamoeba invadens IP1]|eukprot:XP_004183043.1 hypothetical protein EIN_468310 [Entamoeba invadens IP1]